MTKLRDRKKAIGLRKKGMSYSQVRKIVNVSKGTLSLWLCDYPLSEERIKELQGSETRIENFRKTMRRKREARWKQVYQKQSKRWLPLSSRELFIAGLFLYWGEGRKGFASDIAVVNTDPEVIKFFVYWFVKMLKIPKQDLRFTLHLYSDMDVGLEHRFWMRELKISRSQFRGPYIKKTRKDRITHKGGHGHGTCRVYFNNVRLKEEIMMAIEAIAKYYNVKI